MKRAIAFFDFDRTLISGDSIVRLFPYAWRRGLCSTAQLLRGFRGGIRYLLGRISDVESNNLAFAFLEGKTEEEAASFAKDFCRDILSRKLRKKGLREIERLRGEGTAVWLVSASAEFYLRPLAEILHADEVIGTRLAVEDGRYTGKIAGENCRGIQKPLRIAELLASRGIVADYDQSAAFGDSASDWPMLQLGARKVGVNAGQKLRELMRGADGTEFVKW